MPKLDSMSGMGVVLQGDHSEGGSKGNIAKLLWTAIPVERSLIYFDQRHKVHVPGLNIHSNAADYSQEDAGREIIWECRHELH